MISIDDGWIYRSPSSFGESNHERTNAVCTGRLLPTVGAGTAAHLGTSSRTGQGDTPATPARSTRWLVRPRLLAVGTVRHREELDRPTHRGQRGGRLLHH